MPTGASPSRSTSRSTGPTSSPTPGRSSTRSWPCCATIPRSACPSTAIPTTPAGPRPTSACPKRARGAWWNHSRRRASMPCAWRRKATASPGRWPATTPTKAARRTAAWSWCGSRADLSRAGKPEERTRGGGGVGRRHRGLLATVAREFLHDVRQEHRLVAPVPGHRLERARQQVGRIGLHHQPPGRDVADERAQVPAAALVAQPARDSDVPVAVDAVEELGAAAGEAVHHRRTDPALELLHDPDEVGVGVALVQEQRLAGVHRDLELPLEGLALGGPGREIAEVVEAGFTHGDDLGMGEQRAHLGVALGGVLAGVVGMHPCGGEPFAWPAAREFQRHRGMLAAGAGEYRLDDPRIARPLPDLVKVVVEAVVCEVGADVDQLHGGHCRTPAPTATAAPTPQ